MVSFFSCDRTLSFLFVSKVSKRKSCFQELTHISLACFVLNHMHTRKILKRTPNLRLLQANICLTLRLLWLILQNEKSIKLVILFKCSRFVFLFIVFLLFLFYGLYFFFLSIVFLLFFGHFSFIFLVQDCVSNNFFSKRLVVQEIVYQI